MAVRTFRLVFALDVTEETETALPDAETIRNIVEGCCPSAMVEAIQDYCDHEENDPGSDAVTLLSVEAMTVAEVQEARRRLDEGA